MRRLYILVAAAMTVIAACGSSSRGTAAQPESSGTDNAATAAAPEAADPRTSDEPQADGDATRPARIVISKQSMTLSLYDAECKTNLPLVGDKSIFTLKGNCHGRYFLRGSYTATANDDILIPDAISIYSPKRGEVIVTASAPLSSILVYTLDGKLQTARQNVNTEVFCLDLPAGIYVIQAATDGDKETSKIAVK